MDPKEGAGHSADPDSTTAFTFARNTGKRCIFICERY